jgi:transcriptional regulator with XRE-family HTH domain
MTNDETIEKIGQRVLDQRQKMDITQRELAAKSGVSQNYIGLIEKGKANPSIENLIRMARALQIPLAAVIGVNGGRQHRQILALVNCNELASGLDSICEQGGMIKTFERISPFSYDETGSRATYMIIWEE